MNRDIIKEFQEVIENRHKYAEDWKAKTGGKVIGWLCSYCPVEIVHAAGMLPARILGSLEPERLSDEYIYGNVCPYTRDCLAQGLKGRYNYLDGIIHARSCEAIEFAFHSWIKALPIDFSHYIYMPGHIQHPSALPLLIKEYADFKEALEKLGNRSVSEEDLSRAVQEYNENRQMMKQINEFLKKDEPPITGKEFLQIALAGQLMDVREHNEMIRQVLEELPNRKLARDTGVRLMLIGSVNYDFIFMNLVEDLGATVVIEENCCSTKSFWDESIVQENKLGEIAHRYINRWPCPTFDWQATGKERMRYKRIKHLLDDYRIEGVILHQQQFCAPHGYDIPYLSSMLEELNIPSLILEFDVTVPVGQFRTRVEAFLETITLELI